MRKELKVCTPTIRTYLGDAFCYSIINENAFKNGWVYDKYINLEYQTEHKMLKYEGYDYYEFVPDENVFEKVYYQIPMKRIKKKVICENVKRLINRDEYFFCYWNENVIINYFYSTNLKGVYYHGTFVYGYDDAKNVMLVEGYYNNKWDKVEIPYDIFCKAMLLQEELFCFDGFKLNKNYKWNLNKKRLFERLKNYVYQNVKIEDDRTVGINACYMFCEHLLDLSRRKKDFHIPSIYCMYEHMKLMNMRIKHMISIGMLLRGEKIQDMGLMIEQKYTYILNKSMMYNINRSTRDGEKVVNEIINALEMEKNVNKLLKEKFEKEELLDESGGCR